MIYPIFSREFHLKLETVDAVSIDKALETLVKVGVLKLDDQNRITHPSENHPNYSCLLYTSPSPRDKRQSRMPSSA